MKLPFDIIIYFKTEYIEKWRRWIQRICAECKDMKFKKPEFNIFLYDFMIIFRANYKYAYSSVLDNNKELPLSTTPDIKSEILKLIKKQSYNKRKDRKKINIIKDGVKYHLRQLTQKKQVKFVGNSRNGYWEVLVEQKARK